MGSSGKRKTTMAKLTREARLRERRLDKQAKKNARKHASSPYAAPPSDILTGEVDGSDGPVAGEPELQRGVPTLPDA